MRRLILLLVIAIAACAPAEASDVVYNQPVNLAVDELGTVWVVERGGRVVSTEGEVLIDLDLDLTDANQEQGLLSVEFWPGGYFLYVAWPGSGMSELLSFSDGRRQSVRTWAPAPWHYGGGMEYHEPWLYISIGDGAAFAHEAQHLRPDRGAILRYSPDLNAWEPAASGLRNPWSWTLHDGVLYVGDVGNAGAEEINIAPVAPDTDMGAYPNFGWPVFEGSECIEEGCQDLGYVFPAIDYRNPGGSAVIVGDVVDGELVWTDFFTGTIHFTDIKTLETRTVETDLTPTALMVHNDEVWVASIDGRVGPLSDFTGS